jgi:hypothetical protein
MLRSILLLVSAIAVIAIFAIAPQPAAAGSCAVVTAEGRGVNEAKATARAVKHLTFKTNRWAKKDGYSSVHVGKTSTKCAAKGPLTHCIATRKVCG